MTSQLTARELRISNLIYKFGEVIPVSLQTLESIVLDWGVYEPIPLSESWLKKFGFEEGNHNWWKITYEAFGDTKDEFDRMCLQHTVEISVNSSSHYASIQNINDDEQGATVNYKIEYVHQLQNLFYALTGKELQITGS